MVADQSRADRFDAILSLLAEDGRIDVDRIVHTLEVSPATARRDLDALASQQLLSRTRGGAVAHSVAYDLPIRYRNLQNKEAKAAIARVASEMVPKGAVVGLCGGTTATAIADALMARSDIMESSTAPNLTVITNAVNIAVQLAVRPQIKTVVTGGVLNTRTYEMVGSYAEAVMRGVTLDFAFVGVNGLSALFGPTSHDEREAAINALMASRAERPVIVADSSKLDKRTFASIGPRDLFATVITDSGASSAQRQGLSDYGYDVVIAK